MVLQAKKHKVVNILLNQLGALFILNLATAELVLRVEDALGHKYFDNIEERWVAVQVEPNLIQNDCLLRYKLILLTVESHIVCLLTTLESSQTAFIDHLVALLLSLRWLVPR